MPATSWQHKEDVERQAIKFSQSEMIERMFELMMQGGTQAETLPRNKYSEKALRMHIRIYHALYGGVRGSKVEATHLGLWCVDRLARICRIAPELFNYVMANASTKVLYSY